MVETWEIWLSMLVMVLVSLLTGTFGFVFGLVVQKDKQAGKIKTAIGETLFILAFVGYLTWVNRDLPWYVPTATATSGVLFFIVGWRKQAKEARAVPKK